MIHLWLVNKKKNATFSANAKKSTTIASICSNVHGLFILAGLTQFLISGPTFSVDMAHADYRLLPNLKKGPPYTLSSYSLSSISFLFFLFNFFFPPPNNWPNFAHPTNDLSYSGRWPPLLRVTSVPCSKRHNRSLLLRALPCSMRHR
jgi:hypothetical protein